MYPMNCSKGEGEGRRRRAKAKGKGEGWRRRAKAKGEGEGRRRRAKAGGRGRCDADNNRWVVEKSGTHWLCCGPASRSNPARNSRIFNMVLVSSERRLTIYTCFTTDHLFEHLVTLADYIYKDKRPTCQILSAAGWSRRGLSWAVGRRWLSPSSTSTIRRRSSSGQIC